MLQEAQRYLKKGEEKARLSFILGQLLAENNQPALALEGFKTVLKNKPSYELQLQANLAIHQLEGDLVALQQLLKDPKNEENKAAIYVKIGQYHYLKKNYKDAKENWEKGGQNNPNKGELYYQLGGLFAKQLKEYDLAAHYYDSAATYLSATHPDYAKAQKLKKSWGSYTTLSKQIALQDSLLRLANRSQAELHELFLKFSLDGALVPINRVFTLITNKREFKEALNLVTCGAIGIWRIFGTVKIKTLTRHRIVGK